MKVLSKRQVLMLHAALIAESGGCDGIRDEGSWTQQSIRHCRPLQAKIYIPLCLKRLPAWALADTEPSFY